MGYLRADHMLHHLVPVASTSPRTLAHFRRGLSGNTIQSCPGGFDEIGQPPRLRGGHLLVIDRGDRVENPKSVVAEPGSRSTTSKSYVDGNRNPVGSAATA